MRSLPKILEYWRKMSNVEETDKEVLNWSILGREKHT